MLPTAYPKLPKSAILKRQRSHFDCCPEGEEVEVGYDAAVLACLVKLFLRLVRSVVEGRAR